MNLQHDSAVGLLTLAELPGVGERRLRRLQEEARERHLPVARLADLPAAELRDLLGLPAAAIDRLGPARIWHDARCTALADALARRGVELCPPGDVHYPSGWARYGDPPPPLAYLYGNTALLKSPVVALLYSRLVDEATVTATLRLVRAAAGAGCAIAVGGMKTTYRLAAAAAHALDSPRLVVLDRGLLAAFAGRLDCDPFGLGPRRAGFDPRRTLVLTPFRPTDHALPRSGARRDALIAALADLVIAVHARPQGEIEQLCLRALARGQRVAAWRSHNARLMAAGALELDDEDGLGDALPPPAPAALRSARARRR